MVFAKAVKGNGHRAKAGRKQTLKPLRRQGIAVGDHAPGEFQRIKRFSAGLQIGTEQRFSPCDDNADAMGIDPGRFDGTKDGQEVFQRHIP